MYYICVALALWECVGISWTPEVCLTWPNNKGNSLHLSLFFTRFNNNYNNNSNNCSYNKWKRKRFFLAWDACVRVSIDNLFGMISLRSRRSLCLHILRVYISVYVYVYKIIFDYLYTYVYQVSWSPECEHVPLRSRPTSPIFALALWARWKTFIHFCMSFHHLYLSVSVFLYLFLTLFLFLSFCPSLFLIFIFLSSQWDEDAKRIIHLKALFRKTTTNNSKRVIKRF